LLKKKKKNKKKRGRMKGKIEGGSACLGRNKIKYPKKKGSKQLSHFAPDKFPRGGGEAALQRNMDGKAISLAERRWLRRGKREKSY